ncbi:helix-turn-helix domain-containing protein [Marinilabilia salmonicolor]|uniref:helix-turn-helix domain-containing protein n=1 Tax=Marinilabilia salmonicolor TaxID=989 RepID=UPI000687F1EB|nr:helix-turn-helix transcriptional regulator [Marinilabilia salmonicolor]
MQERIKEILSQERLSPARFAELVGVQRSSVSHIISGRNKPSLDFLQKILTHFEHISPDWLITGKGPYKRSEALSGQGIATTKQSGTDGKIVISFFCFIGQRGRKGSLQCNTK